MPGPPRWRTPLLIHHCLTAQKLHVSDIDERVTNLLTFVQKLARISPDTVYGDGIERSRDTLEMRSFCRKLAAEGTVLLKNEKSVLPIRPGKVKRIAVIGPNADARVISGGGSAALKPTYVVTPLAGIRENAPHEIEIKYSVGCYGEL